MTTFDITRIASVGSPKNPAVCLSDKVNDRADRKSRSRIYHRSLHLQLFSFTSIKQRTQRKTGSPRDLLYMQIKDGYGGNRGMWWRLTETRYRQVSSVKRTLPTWPSSFPPSNNFERVQASRRFIFRRAPYVYILFVCVIFTFWMILTQR